MKHSDYFRWSIQNTLRLTMTDVAQQTSLTVADKAQALHILEFALALPEAWSDIYALIRLISPAMERNGQRRRWVKILNHALPIANAHHDSAAAAHIHWILGMLLRQISDFPAAQFHLQQSHAIAIVIGDRSRAANALTELAYLYQMQHQLAEAKQLVADAHALLSPDDPMRAAGYSVLGDIYYSEQRWAEAITAIVQAITLWQTTAKPTLAASGWRGVARVHWAKGEQDCAFDCYQRALDLYRQLGDPLQLALTRMGLGTLHLARQELTAALREFALAEERLLQVGDRFHLAMLDLNYGIAHRQMGELDLALPRLQHSLQYYEESADAHRQVNVLTELVVVQLAAGTLQQADWTLAQAEARLDSLQGTNTFPSLQGTIVQLRQQIDSALPICLHHIEALSDA